MKTPTEPYRRLKKKLRDVSSIMSRLPQNSCDTNLHHLKVQSYILLSHAAFEEYLEELCMEVSTEALRLFNDEGIISKCLVSLTAYETIAQIDDEISRKKITTEVANNFPTFANVAVVNLHKQIEENHGVKKKNQKSLMMPIGVDPENADLVTFGALDALGFKRGDIAHKVKISRTETRSSILTDNNVITEGLLEFDKAARENLKIRMKKT